MSASSSLPRRCYWELTRRCAGACIFCRNGGATESNELSLSESLRVADELIGLGIRRVVLTGGEPTRYRGWEEIAERLTGNGVGVWLFTSGMDLTDGTIAAARRAGISRVLIPLDGDGPTHRRLRPLVNENGMCSYEAALSAVQRCTAAGLPVVAVTEVNHINVPVLEDIYAILLKLGVRDWQVHLCQMTGRAADHREELICTSADMEAIVRMLKRVAVEKQIHSPLHCSIGYMVPEEALLRSPNTEGRLFFDGCPAGVRTFGITPSGQVKGCTALGDEFATASLRRESLASILNNDDYFAYTRKSEDHRTLEGACARCSFGSVCKGGCPAVAYGLTGAIGANPSCLHILRNGS
jgi:radical SAM protein with 4Fe4S-binding SPASM domain